MEQELQRRYALALSLVPDPDAAADLFMAARDDDDLHRRAAAWRSARRLPPAPVAPALPELDPVQQEYALHLGRRARLRRRTMPWIAGAAAGLMLLSAASVLQALRRPEPPRLAGSEAAPAAASPRRGPEAVPIQRQSGRAVASDAVICGRVDVAPSRLGESVLVLTLPYSPRGPEPVVAAVTLDSHPTPNWPGRLSLDVRAQFAEGESNSCYLVTAQLDLPEAVKGRQLAVSITIRPESFGSGMTYWSDPVLIP